MQLSQLEKVFCTPATRSLTSAACEAMLSFSFSFSFSSLFSVSIASTGMQCLYPYFISNMPGSTDTSFVPVIPSERIIR